MSTAEQEVTLPIPATPDYDGQKKQLEIEKLNKEIQILDSDLRKKWYRKPQWIAALSPFFLGILTLIIALSTGLIQNQSTLNKIQEENFNHRKQQIYDSIFKLQHFSDSLSNQVTELNIKKIILDSSLVRLTSLKEDLSSKLSDKDKQLSKITRGYLKIENELLMLKFSILEEKISSFSKYSIAIPDSILMHVTDQEIQDYINQHKGEYKGPYVDFKAKP
jgi:hypothetical protein